jgi:hypothetical protein
MISEKAAEENTTVREVTPSLFDLLQFFLNEEFGEEIIGLSRTGKWDEYIIFLRIRDKDNPHIVTTNNMVGTVDGHDVTINVSALDKYFNWHRTHAEIRNVAHPEFFEWLTRSIKHEYYRELRELEYLNEDGTRNTGLRGPHQRLASRDTEIR